jgi:hypothetical protein
MPLVKGTYKQTAIVAFTTLYYLLTLLSVLYEGADEMAKHTFPEDTKTLYAGLLIYVGNLLFVFSLMFLTLYLIIDFYYAEVVDRPMCFFMVAGLGLFCVHIIFSLAAFMTTCQFTSCFAYYTTLYLEACANLMATAFGLFLGLVWTCKKLIRCYHNSKVHPTEDVPV